MGKLSEFFNNPGSRPTMYYRAPAAVPRPDGSTVTELHDVSSSGSSVSSKDKDDVSVNCSYAESDMNEVVLTKRGHVQTSRGFTGLRKGITDHCMDWMVAWAGSQFVFFFMWIILAVWCIIGIVYKAPSVWQVVMQDGQSIQCYIWDTLLMRQQLISTHEQLSVCGNVRSRIGTLKRLFSSRQLSRSSGKKDLKDDCVSVHSEEMQCNSVTERSATEGKLPSETWYDKFCSFTSVILGSLYVIIIFWICIFIWIGTGALWIDAGNSPPYTGEKTGSNPRLARFADNWQLYINTATAVVLMVCSVFLQNIRSRHDKYIGKFIRGIMTMDVDIETEARRKFGDFDTQNPVIAMETKKRGWGQRSIDFYADVIGTGIGIIIAIVVFSIWLGIGNQLSWSDDWWLIIGTYTGLMGYLDGFVIREAYHRITNKEEHSYRIVAEEDLELFHLAGITCPPEYTGLDIPTSKSLDYKVSAWISHVCSSPLSVLFAVCSVIGLIIISSALHWSTTGQLIANTPTMIIEAFLLIVLIQAHNWADQRRRIEVSSLYARRCILLAHLQRI
ncbi:hypothetical protein ZYGR_0Y00280 [Zygosaccharomyces rouxii]|uniref:ZYRO0F18678p n=2 Tax=Zygosaccharomyces rouxii TaxID=4956 RepID=C5DZ70_ZYGRC|nr:uncharacterized protein ZYRO0F18678g [Zygosaccharomyces rouxii]KAH9201208.1 Low affinity iron permease-domain-containing protein [Zygosaccharomyces rouxii]GAV50586.1 hypothetical protein ZYGR_0Y00280 [Zygosaccharomyces rouxii]CAR29081.1 ZYRO0F18678p [Zygosaccharomyces rouxii]